MYQRNVGNISPLLDWNMVRFRTEPHLDIEHWEYFLCDVKTLCHLKGNYCKLYIN